MSRSHKSRAGWLFALLAAGAIAPSTTLAQPAAALGHPLPDGSLPTGTVGVRIIAGSAASPVIGTDVTLLVGGQAQVARTDTSGRAMCNNLPVGTQVQAKIKVTEGPETKELTSDTFAVPDSGGVRVMLSTRPSAGGGGGPMGGGGGPMAGGGGAGGMPNPRQISGQPRPDRDTPGATYIVRLTYDDLMAKPGDPKGPPAGQLVTLVGYAADDSVLVQSTTSDDQGRATFDNLDPSGSVGYFALVNLPRGTGVDRLYSLPIQMDAQSGVRTILSGEKRDSGLPNIDQYATQQTITTPPGKVRVTLEGLPTPEAPIRLVDAATQAVVAQTTAKSMESDPASVQGGSRFEAKPDLAASTLDVTVHGGVGADAPLAGVEIRVIAADAQNIEGDPVKSGPDGKVRATAPAIEAGKQQRAVFRILGRDFVSEPFDVTKNGGAIDITAKWSAEGRPQGLFDVAYKPGQVLYAEASVSGKLAGTYRSLPFMPIEQSGTHVGVIVYPRLITKFTMRASIEDQLLAVQGRWTIENNSWIPYRESADGMGIPLPAHHKGGVIAEMNQADVAVVPGEGFKILRPLPPGSGKSFVAGFSLPIDGGTTEWALDLPLGTVGSDISIKQMPGMHVESPTAGRTVDGKDGEPSYRIDNITIGRGKSMVMTISGLPSPAGWKIWAPRFVGVLVVLVIMGGLCFALLTRRSVPATQALARKNALLEELVELERSGANNARREQLVAELEKLWGA